MTSILYFIIIIFYMFCASPRPTFQISSDKTCYIVLVDEPPSVSPLTSLHSPEDLNTYYNSFLSPPVSTTTSSNIDDIAQHPRIIRSYRHALTGFAVMLSANELQELVMKKGVISAQPERILSLHTTHSPSFLGLNQNIGPWSYSNQGEGVIIGLLDTGIFPEHLSYSQHGIPPRPAKWKGKPCELANFTCNNKIIGARSFVNGTALDDQGHGTHTSSTAAGNFVEGANLFGNAKGTAAGIAPRAHLAIYKVCTPTEGCPNSAIIAAIDAAIEDGVDVLSISLGGEVIDHFYEDFMAISAFRAMEKGILVSFSAGNDGPWLWSVVNGAPWALTVGASTIDREISATVVLGNNNNRKFHGQSAFQPKPGFRGANKNLPLVYVGNCSDARSLSAARVKGKMAVCELLRYSIDGEEAVRNAGGAAMILVNEEVWANTTFSDAHTLPAAHVSYADGLSVKSYINSTTRPVARIVFGGTVIGGGYTNIRAPVVGGFSSRGPNSPSPGILKPDVLGPGVNILAAWPTSVENVFRTNKDEKKSTFNIVSGTSMACPHLSGVAALLKSAHPDWSPAAIKSAILTTADDVDHAYGPILDANFVAAEIFTTGAGHVNPVAATGTGLVYDMKPEDYVPYLCGLNYTDQQVRLFSKNIPGNSCSRVKSIPEAELNYPSFSLTFDDRATNPQTYTRTVTNVGDPRSSYMVIVVSPPDIEVRVVPKILNFSKLNQKLKYNVTFSRKASSTLHQVAVKGFLKLCSYKQCVTSPIAVILL